MSLVVTIDYESIGSGNFPDQIYSLVTENANMKETGKMRFIIHLYIPRAGKLNLIYKTLAFKFVYT